MKTLLLSLLLGCLTLTASAQSDPEYRMEIGAGAGVMSYMGDFNGSPLKEMQPSATLLARYRFNPRSGLALNVSYGKLTGSSESVETWYPDYQEVPYSFDNTLIDVGLRYEHNFWPYGTGREYYGAKPLTPYVAIGLGMSIVSGNKSVAALNLPIGVGVKYKVAQRVNLGLEWAVHFASSDKLDGVSDPYGIKSSGMFKNTDCYSMVRLFVTYDISAKCRTCHNDDF